MHVTQVSDSLISKVHKIEKPTPFFFANDYFLLNDSSLILMLKFSSATLINSSNASFQTVCLKSYSSSSRFLFINSAMVFSFSSPLLCLLKRSLTRCGRPPCCLFFFAFISTLLLFQIHKNVIESSLIGGALDWFGVDLTTFTLVGGKTRSDITRKRGAWSRQTRFIIRE